MEKGRISRLAESSTAEPKAGGFRRLLGTIGACFESCRCTLWLLSLYFSCLAIVYGADEALTQAEHQALNSTCNAESAYLRRVNVQLVAPVEQQQIQELTDEIGAACGSQKHFTVYLLNEGFLGTQSYANGDIFLPTAYLDMVADRDELAFGLAREIGMQVKDLRLKEMKGSIQRARSRDNANLIFGIILSSAAGAAWGYYVERPIVEEMARHFQPRYHNFESYMLYQGTVRNTAKLVNNSLGWVPVLVTQKTLTTSAHMLEVATEDTDEEKRHFKDRLGIAYMQMAGYSGDAGQRVIKKLDEFWGSTAINTNAPPPK